jgi:DNA-directed RNA polymerase subunit RPC12/RpoP
MDHASKIPEGGDSMARVICKCGQQFRTSAKPGTQVQCPRCANAVSVTEKVFDLQDRIRGPHSLAVNPESDRFGEVTSAENLQNRRGTNRSRLWLAVGFATVGLAAAMILAIAFWNGGNGQRWGLIKKQPNQKTLRVKSSPRNPRIFDGPRWPSGTKIFRKIQKASRSSPTRGKSLRSVSPWIHFDSGRS